MPRVIVFACFAPGLKHKTIFLSVLYHLKLGKSAQQRRALPQCIIHRVSLETKIFKIHDKILRGVPSLKISYCL